MSSTCPSPDRGRTSRTARAGRALACLVVLPALLVTACGIGVQTEPAPLTVPSATPTGTVSPSSPSGVRITMQVYLVKGQHLQRVERLVPEGPGLTPVLTALSEPLTPAELGAGLRSALPPLDHPLKGTLGADAVARIQAPPGFDRLRVVDQALVGAQLTFTLTANTLSGSVQIYEGKRPLTVPVISGRLVTTPLTRADFADVAPTD